MILIMCAGEATRFNGAIKQLLPMGDECIVCRTIRQLKERDCAPVMVSRHRDLQRLARHEEIGYFAPQNNETLLKSIQSTGPLWEDKTTILLGDVIYTNETMDRILAHEDTAFFGDAWEIYAVVIGRGDWHIIDKGIEDVGKTGATGKLGQLYNALCGNEPGTPRAGMEDAPCWEHVRDWTRDVDSARTYQLAVRELVGQGVLQREKVYSEIAGH